MLQYLERIGKTLWQAAVGSVAVSQVTAAVVAATGTHKLGALGTLSMTALGAVSAAAVSLVKNAAFKPSTKGLVGVAERAVGTFIAGAAGAVVVSQVQAAVQHADLHALAAVSLAALGGGVTAVLSLAQNTANLPAK